MLPNTTSSAVDERIIVKFLSAIVHMHQYNPASHNWVWLKIKYGSSSEFTDASEKYHRISLAPVSGVQLNLADPFTSTTKYFGLMKPTHATSERK